jgi:hypothetical protein
MSTSQPQTTYSRLPKIMGQYYIYYTFHITGLLVMLPNIVDYYLLSDDQKPQKPPPLPTNPF